VVDRESAYKAFGRLLAARRRKAGLSQAQLAGLIGLSRTSITNIECGRQAVLLHQVYEFANILETPLQELIPALPEGIQGHSLEVESYLQKLKQLPTVGSASEQKSRQ
jgi:transcriptional regulator with XRE-family HTH domain